MRELTPQEIDEVSGALGPVGGAIVGVGTYYAGTLMTGEDPTVAGAVGSAIFGAVTGGFGMIGRGVMGKAGQNARDIVGAAHGSIAGAAGGNIADAIYRKWKDS